MSPRSRFSLIVLLSISACRSGGAAPAAEASESGHLKPWREAIAGTRAEPGLVMHRTRPDGSILLELGPTDLDRDLGLVLHVVSGPVDLGLAPGQALGPSRLVRFVRAGDRVYLVDRLVQVRASDPALGRAATEGSSSSVLAALDVLAEDDTHRVLVDASALALTDVGDVARILRDAYEDVALDRTRSFTRGAHAGQGRLELDAALTFSTEHTPSTGGFTTADYRAISTAVSWSFFALPDPPMTPRAADDRVGFLDTPFIDLSRAPGEDPLGAYVSRWRLEKRAPGPAPSPPKQPITVVLDPTIPTEWRDAVREGVLAWRPAFADAGFPDAIVVADAPREDGRAITVRFVADYAVPWATGSADVDPRSGEILRADVLISSEFVRFGGNTPSTGLASGAHACEAARGVSAELGVASLMLAMKEADRFGRSDDRAEVARERAAVMAEDRAIAAQPDLGAGRRRDLARRMLRWVVLHEVGHALGLRHNFKASSVYAAEELANPDFVRAHGTAASVMDYVPFALGASDPDLLIAREPGPYDRWAIQVGYTTGDPASLLVRASDRFLAFASDADAPHDEPALDPHVRRFDLGPDPVAWAESRAAAVDGLLPRVPDLVVRTGESYARARPAVLLLLDWRENALLGAIDVVGGSRTSRRHRGDPGEAMPAEPIPAAEQRRALGVVCDLAFGAKALELPPSLLTSVPPYRGSGFAHYPGGYAAHEPADFPLLELERRQDDETLDALLHPTRLARIANQELVSARPPTGKAVDVLGVAELFRTLTNAIWPEAGDKTSAAGRQRQRSYVAHLAKLVLPEPAPKPSDAPAFVEAPRVARMVPEDARSAARGELVELRERIGRRLRRVSAGERGHLLETDAEIGRVLSATMQQTPASGRD